MATSTEIQNKTETDFQTNNEGDQPSTSAAFHVYTPSDWWYLQNPHASCTPEPNSLNQCQSSSTRGIKHSNQLLYNHEQQVTSPLRTVKLTQGNRDTGVVNPMHSQPTTPHNCINQPKNPLGPTSTEFKGLDKAGQTTQLETPPPLNPWNGQSPLWK
ncbi:hypothetical protein GYMLUDRAFT_60990 [Collybiopsis luxurians FD-317 M1]|uniref:Uncharacterized protein n=1 Tax=Collybiopsis luxurians FD-317 M1 TaxID=944289 RepID=A0A0D0BRP8_9AGAR|nr:hypothetical protein GYMLUDRAFT_60990 [Collybiopsis luxurians FD-317 M1]